MFAIMGLRALYFLLAGMADRFHYLKDGLAMVLVFIGGKMRATQRYHLPVQVFLDIVGLNHDSWSCACQPGARRRKHLSSIQWKTIKPYSWSTNLFTARCLNKQTAALIGLCA